MSGWERMRRNLGSAMVFALVAVALAIGVTGCGSSASPQGPLQDAKRLSEEATTAPIPLADTIAGPSGGAYLGVFMPPAPFSMKGLDDYEELSGRRAAILMWYQPWDETGQYLFDTAACVSTMRRGAVPMITWEPWRPGNDPNMLRDPEDQPQYSLKRIIDGDYDEYITSWAVEIRKLGGPVMLRPMHEMNGTWYPWSGTVNGNTPEQFVKAWRHIHDIFEREGATNVTWVWSINCNSVPKTAQNSYDKYYPGDEYVDWTSISGFNWGRSTPTQQWREISQLYKEPVAYLESLGKPIVVSEMASVTSGGSRPAWIRRTYASFPEQFPAVGGVVYYNNDEARIEDKQDWAIHPDTESQVAFRDAIANPYYLEGPVPELESWAKSLTARQWANLQRTPKRY